MAGCRRCAPEAFKYVFVMLPSQRAPFCAVYYYLWYISLFLYNRFKTVFGARYSAWRDHASCIPVLPRCDTWYWFSIYTYMFTATTLFLALLFIFALQTFEFHLENVFTLSGLHVAWEERVQLCAIHGIAPHTRRCEFLSALSWSYQLSLYITRSCFCNSTHDNLSPVGLTCCKFFSAGRTRAF